MKRAKKENGKKAATIANLAVWNSDTEEESVSPEAWDAICRINGIAELSAWAEDGMVAVSSAKTGIKEAVADYIEGVKGFPWRKVKWVKSDESAGVAWYEVK